MGHGFQHTCLANDERIWFNHNAWYNSQMLSFVKEARTVVPYPVIGHVDGGAEALRVMPEHDRYW
jgi:hypothetical protein